jgi:hypothetical protein
MRSGMHEDGSKHRLISQSSQHMDMNGNRVDALHWPSIMHKRLPRHFPPADPISTSRAIHNRCSHARPTTATIKCTPLAHPSFTCFWQCEAALDNEVSSAPSQQGKRRRKGNTIAAMAQARKGKETGTHVHGRDSVYHPPTGI